MRTVGRLLPLVCAALMGCAGTSTVRTPAEQTAIAMEQREQLRVALETSRTRNDRLQRVAFPLLQANTVLCDGKVRPIIGVDYATLWDHDEKVRAVASEVFGLSKRYTLTRILPEGPADRAGLLVGDVLVSLDDEPIPPVQTERAAKRARRDLDELWDRALDDHQLIVRIERQGEIAPFVMEATLVCAYPVELVDDTEIGAFTDGETITVSTGMLRFAETDLELQTVISHELAHAIEDHIGKMKRNLVAGALLGALVDVVAAAAGVSTGGAATQIGAMMGAGAFSQDFEREADYVGLYLLANAGVDTELAANFWRRIAVESAGSILYAKSHPTSAERFVNLTSATAEIASKQLGGEELLPNREGRFAEDPDHPQRMVERTGEELSPEERVEKMRREGEFLGYFRCDQVRAAFPEGVPVDVILAEHRSALDPDRDGIACEPD